ncbi:AAA family ATPase [Lentzea aerocolonigenes]|uniref:AAA family ATPase n=1 Tax=Lentzea aerocolonigenes TaxID=68170 RepID=UPI0018C88B19|nr:AAA family ATPase [Lentzea aerocolonigenes]
MTDFYVEGGKREIVEGLAIVKVSLTNVGPVRSANIEIKPMTIFMGPNNSGKSLLATVMYAALARAGSELPIRSVRAIRQMLALSDQDATEIGAYLYEAIDDSSIHDYETVPKKLREILQRRLDQVLHQYGAAVVDELERATGAAAASLRRVHDRPQRASVTVSSARPNWSIKISLLSRGPKIEVVASPDLREVWSSVNRRAWARMRTRRVGVREVPRTYLLRELATEIARALFRDAPAHTRYMPAARSGLMQSHKVLAGTLIRRSSLAGLEDVRIPSMSGVVTDFLSELIEIDPHFTSPFDQDAKYLESEVLNGNIRLDETVGGYPEVVYETEAGDFPLTRTSSMVSELAPVVVYLRSILKPRDLLIIEEPEAHLHPASQIILARLLVRLVNRGLSVALTSHSEFFLQQINNCIVAGFLKKPSAASVDFGDEIRLDASKVNAYLFSPGSAGSGTIVSSLEMTPTEGISDSGFEVVAEHLYNETVALDRRMNAQS